MHREASADLVSSGPSGTKGKRPKHIPERTCVACRSVRPKRELVRIVRTPEGKVEPDPTGKHRGRGAYLCPIRACWELALKKKGLESVLKTTISPEDLARLRDYAANELT